MRPISPGIKKKLLADVFMKTCCLCGEDKKKIEWHHNLIYGGRQADTAWTILPLCIICHRGADKKETKERLDWIMISRASEEDLDKYPRFDFKQRKRYLEGKLGIIKSLQSEETTS